MSRFTEQDHARLARLFGPRSEWDSMIPLASASRLYAGYKPEVREAPNGDTKACPDCRGKGVHVWHDGAGLPRCRGCNGTGRVPNVDAEGVCEACKGDGNPCRACHSTGRTPAKRWLHVCPKYSPPQWAADYYDRAFAEACRVATALGVPAAYRPHEAFGALRVLEYPPGAGTVEHTDFDLFSIVLWRSTPADLELTRRACRCMCDTGSTGIRSSACGAHYDAVSPGLHIGEIGALIGLGPATPHRVPARPYAQKSLIYFAIPDHAAPLECDCPRPDLHGHRPYLRKPEAGACRGTTVGAWLEERIKRSRYDGA